MKSIRAPRERSRLDISSPRSFRLLHSLRACHDAVLIGSSTLAVDSPRLNVRDPLSYQVGNESAIRQPRPIVLDSSLRFLDVTNIHLKRPIIFSSYLNAIARKGELQLSNEQRLQRWSVAAERARSLDGELVSCLPDSSDR